MLKSDRLRERERKHESEQLLGPIADERFALLVNLAKKITDWGVDEKAVAGEWQGRAAEG